MSQQEDKRVVVESSSEKTIKPEESEKEDSTGLQKAAPTPEPQQREPVVARTFYCACRDCKLYFGKGNPIECVNPNIVEMRYPKWKFAKNSSANRVPIFRRPADPDTRKEGLEKDKRRKR